MAVEEKEPVQQAAQAAKDNAPAAPRRAPTPFELYADMRHAAPRPSPYEALESAGPPV